MGIELNCDATGPVAPAGPGAGIDAARLKPGQVFNPHRMFSGVFVPEALVRSSKLSHGAKLAYGRLARYAGKDGGCYPSLATLGRELGTSRDSAKRYVEELTAERLIRLTPRKTEAGDADTSAVTFLWHTIFEPEWVGAEIPPPGRGENAPTVGAEMPRGVGAKMPPKESHVKRVPEEAAATRPARVSAYPLTMAAAGARFPMNEGFLGKLVAAARSVRPDVKDADIADAVAQTFRADQRNAGLWLSTVPEYLSRAQTGTAIPATTACSNCLGCGMVAEADDTEPRMCPRCGGSGATQQGLTRRGS